MAESERHRCRNCKKLSERVAELEVRLAELEEKLAKATKHSGNSSKPPSSDIVNPPKKQPKKGRGKKRKQGGQPGHRRHERPAFSPEEIDHSQDYFYLDCPDCGHLLEMADALPRVIQQVEIEARPISVQEHRAQRRVGVRLLQRLSQVHAA